MITESKLDTYIKFRGDIDGWARAASDAEAQAFSEEEWSDIQKLLSDLKVVRNGLGSAAFAARVHERLKDLAASPEVASRLEGLEI